MMKNVTTPHSNRILNVLATFPAMFLAMFLALALVLPGAAFSAAPSGDAWGTACKELPGRKDQHHCCKNKKGECITACYGQGLSDKEMSRCDSGCRRAKSDCQDYVFNN